jgi:hypothetical protein
MQGRSGDLPVVHLRDCCEGKRKIQDGAIQWYKSDARVSIDVAEQGGHGRNGGSAAFHRPASFRQGDDG